MSYSSIVDGIILTITRHADFSCSIVKRDDMRHLGAGVARYVNVVYGGFAREEITFANVNHNWNVNLDVYTQYTGELPTTSTDAMNNMQNILDTLDAWPKLSDTTGVGNFEIVGISPIEPMNPDTRNGFQKQQLSLLVEETVCPTRNE